MPFRDSILEISPPFLTEEGGVSEALQYTTGVLLDGVGDWIIEGVKASMPGVGTNDALYLIGKDVGIDRGPTETDAHYIERLRGAVDSHRVQGSAPELLRQLAAWFSPSTATPIRLVSNNAVWHSINPTTLAVTKTIVGTNWTWDAYTSERWFRGWVILDSSASPWVPKTWGGGWTWGDGGTWGSDATVSEVKQIQAWVEKWKPGHIACINIIVTFDASLFEVSDTSPPNPNGTADTVAWQATQNALFWDGAL